MPLPVFKGGKITIYNRKLRGGLLPQQPLPMLVRSAPCTPSACPAETLVWTTVDSSHSVKTDYVVCFVLVSHSELESDQLYLITETCYAH